MFKKLTPINVTLAAGTGGSIGWYAWVSQSPFLLILAIAVAVTCFIGGVMGCWPYLTQEMSHAQTVQPTL